MRSGHFDLATSAIHVVSLSPSCTHMLLICTDTQASKLREKSRTAAAPMCTTCVQNDEETPKHRRPSGTHADHCNQTPYASRWQTKRKPSNSSTCPSGLQVSVTSYDVRHTPPQVSGFAITSRPRLTRTTGTASTATSHSHPTKRTNTLTFGILPLDFHSPAVPHPTSSTKRSITRCPKQ
jgi:hypothetical protein